MPSTQQRRLLVLAPIYGPSLFGCYYRHLEDREISSVHHSRFQLQNVPDQHCASLSVIGALEEGIHTLPPGRSVSCMNRIHALSELFGVITQLLRVWASPERLA